MRASASIPAPSRDLYLVGNYLDIPEAQDPLGLTRADWNADPRQVVSVATQFNTRKSVEQLQGGVVFEQRFARHPVAARHGLRRATARSTRCWDSR